MTQIIRMCRVRASTSTSHSPSSAPRIAPYSQTDRSMAWVSPCVADVNPAYLRNKPTAWVNGFTIAKVRANGDFQVYPVIVSRGVFTFAGTTFGAKTKSTR